MKPFTIIPCKKEATQRNNKTPLGVLKNCKQAGVKAPHPHWSLSPSEETYLTPLLLFFSDAALQRGFTQESEGLFVLEYKVSLLSGVLQGSFKLFSTGLDALGTVKFWGELNSFSPVEL